MRVLDGKFRNQQLQSLNSKALRPTARRIREELFELLSPRLAGARFLDLCAGSGAVGIEALSRGAAHATFVDCSSEACDFIRGNVQMCGAPAEQYAIIMTDVATLPCIFAENAFNIVFFDPPYSLEYEPILELLGTGIGLDPGRAVVVAEHHFEKRLPDRFGVLRRWRLVRRGETCLSFYERKRTAAQIDARTRPAVASGADFDSRLQAN